MVTRLVRGRASASVSLTYLLTFSSRRAKLKALASINVLVAGTAIQTR